MSATAAIANSYKEELLQGIHSSSDTYKIALYTAANASLDANTTDYTTTGEITGTGYTAGGATLSGFAASLSSGTAQLSFTSPSWASATITADTALVYNSSKSNKAVAVLTFASTASTNGTFVLTVPASGIIQLS